MAELELFEKLTLSQIARWLDVHPFDIARALGNAWELPSRLSFEETEVDRLRNLVGVETWWDGGALPIQDDSRRRALVRSLAHKLRAREAGRSTRADNLARGLDGEEQSLIRRAVNQFIRDGVLVSTSTARGLEVEVSPESSRVLDALVDGRDIPKHLEALWA